MKEEIADALIEYNNLCHTRLLPIAFESAVGKAISQALTTQKNKLIEAVEELKINDNDDGVEFEAGLVWGCNKIIKIIKEV